LLTLLPPSVGWGRESGKRKRKKKKIKKRKIIIMMIRVLIPLMCTKQVMHNAIVHHLLNDAQKERKLSLSYTWLCKRSLDKLY